MPANRKYTPPRLIDIADDRRRPAPAATTDTAATREALQAAKWADDHLLRERERLRVRSGTRPARDMSQEERLSQFNDAMFLGNELRDRGVKRLVAPSGTSTLGWFRADPFLPNRATVAAPSVRSMVAELAHAEQFRDKVPFPLNVRGLVERIIHGDLGTYETPGTLEYEAHEIIEPRKRKELERWRAFASGFPDRFKRDRR